MITDFSFLDVPQFRDKYTSDATQTKIRFFVAGVRCEKCIRKLEGLVETTPGLLGLRVELGRKLVDVEVDPSQVSFSKIASLIEAQGFEPVPVAKEEDALKQERSEDRRELIRLGIAGALAGNIMTFAFATYFGGDARLFTWLSLALYFPVVTYVAWPFYVGAFQSIRFGRISIDLPMTVASLAGFIFSTVELLRAHPENTYYDSLSGFLFLILASRWSQKRLQRRFLRPEELTEGLKLDRARVETSEGWSWRSSDSLKPGDVFFLDSSEVLPADAKLASSHAHFSFAWLTGEAKPKTILAGGTVPAGSKLLSSSARLLVEKTLPETGFGKILAQVQKYSMNRNPLVMASDRWAQVLLTVVFSIAALFLVAYWSVSPEEAIRRALALIVLACPCAMAFGTPLALSAALRKARQAGLILRDARVFSATSSVQTIFFDKTGTLTEAGVTLVGPHDIDRLYKQVVLSLENESHHPIAFAFRKAYGSQTHPLPVAEWSETAGSGVRGKIHGVFYELRRTKNLNTNLSCGLYSNGHLLHEFHFAAATTPYCKETLTDLRARGFQLCLLSGDNSAATNSLGRQLGFAPEEIFAGLSPEDKANHITRTPNSMMVGDGVNDSLALMQAAVGIAASGGVGSALKSASVYLTDSSLRGVATLFDISEEALGLIRQNLLISAVYNVLGGSLALLGFINPFVAAILMPISSGFILLSTWIRSRT